MAGKQIYATPKRKCSRCLFEKRNTEKVSERLWPPAGGYLCLECLVPAAIEALGVAPTLPDPPEKDTRPFFACPDCHRITYESDHIKQKFCPRCEWWTGDPVMGKVKKEDRV